MKIHQPLTNDDLIKNNNYRKRLAYDELFSNQIAISIIRKFNQKNIGINIKKNNNIYKSFMNKLPFRLTNSQKISINEINNE